MNTNRLSFVTIILWLFGQSKNSSPTPGISGARRFNELKRSAVARVRCMPLGCASSEPINVIFCKTLPARLSSV
jgi:hypothetical protein